MTQGRDLVEEIKRIAEASKQHVESLVMEWLPGGRRESREWVVRNPTRADGKPGSFKVNMDTGEWAEFAAPQEGGKDLVKLRAYLNGNLGQKGAQIQAAIEICERIGFPTFLTRDNQPPRGRDAGDQRRQAAPPAPAESVKQKSEERISVWDDPEWKLARTYDYHDPEGEVVIQTCRFERLDGTDKSFRQRHILPNKRHKWGVKGIPQVPYNLLGVLDAIEVEGPIYFVEGEKCAERLIEAGATATTNAMGSGKWFDELTEYFRGADIILVPDNDKPGQDHMELVGRKLKPVASRVRLLNLPGLKAKEDIYDWLEAGNSAETLHDLASKAPVWRSPPPDSKFGALTWRQMDQPGRAYKWLIRNLLTEGEVGMTAGPSGTGKSFLVLDMALHMVRGVEYLGRRVKRCGVLYQAGEGGRGLLKRMRAYRQYHGIPEDEDLPFALLPRSLDIHNSDEPIDAMIQEALAWNDYFLAEFGVPLGFIVIDTLSAATVGAEENGSRDTSRILERCGRLRDATQTHVHLVHHMNADGTKVRGHTSLLANLENVLATSYLMRKDDRGRDLGRITDGDGRDIRKASVLKQKDGEAGVGWNFVLDRVSLGLDAHGDEEWSCVIDYHTTSGERKTPASRNKPMSSAEKIALRTLEELSHTKGQPPTQASKLPQSLLMVRYTDWVEAFIASTFHDTPEDAKKVLARVGQNLLARRLIGREAPFVWIPKLKRTETENPAPQEGEDETLR